jgi:hypothetical protein
MFAVMLAAAVMLAQEKPLPGPKISWPEVKGFIKQKPSPFKDKSLGYSLSYFADESSLSATVYVYNLGRESIPAGPRSDAVKAEMLESLNALELNRQNGRYKTLAPAGETIVSPGGKSGAEFRRRRYEVDITKEGEGVTELYVTVYKDHFVKVRTTFLNKDRAACEKQLAKLMEALAAELK